MLRVWLIKIIQMASKLEPDSLLLVCNGQWNYLNILKPSNNILSFEPFFFFREPIHYTEALPVPLKM